MGACFYSFWPLEGVLEASWGPLGASWEPLGNLLEPLGVLLGPPGGLLGPLGDLLAVFCRPPGPSEEPLGASRG